MQQVHAVPKSDKFKFHHHTLLPEVVLFFDLYFFKETKKRCILKPIYFMTQFLPSVRSFDRAFVCLSVRLSIRPYPYYCRNFKESIVPLYYTHIFSGGSPQCVWLMWYCSCMHSFVGLYSLLLHGSLATLLCSSLRWKYYCSYASVGQSNFVSF